MKRHITLFIGAALVSTGVWAQGLYVPAEDKDGWFPISVAIEEALGSLRVENERLPSQIPNSDWSALQALKQGQQLEVTIQLPGDTVIITSDFCKDWASLSITTGTHQVQFRSVSATSLRVDYTANCPNAEYRRDWVKKVVLVRDGERVPIYAAPAPSANVELELWNLMLQQAMREHTRGDYTYMLLDRTVPAAHIRSHVLDSTMATPEFPAFLKRNEIQVPVAGLTLPANVRMVDAEKARPREPGRYWYDDFPRTILTQLSRPFLCEDGKRTLTYWWTSGGFDDARGICYEWEKRDGRWELGGSPCGWIT